MGITRYRFKAVCFKPFTFTHAEDSLIGSHTDYYYYYYTIIEDDLNVYLR